MGKLRVEELIVEIYIKGVIRRVKKSVYRSQTNSKYSAICNNIMLHILEYEAGNSINEMLCPQQKVEF